MSKEPRLTKLNKLLEPSLPANLSRRLPSRELQGAWRRMVGSAIAEKARPVALEQSGILVVAVKGTIWRQELSFRAPELVDGLNEQGFGLERIKLVLDRSQSPPPPPRPELPDLDESEEGRVKKSVAQVEDPELQKALANVARAAMRARKADHI